MVSEMGGGHPPSPAADHRGAAALNDHPVGAVTVSAPLPAQRSVLQAAASHPAREPSSDAEGSDAMQVDGEGSDDGVAAAQVLSRSPSAAPLEPSIAAAEQQQQAQQHAPGFVPVSALGGSPSAPLVHPVPPLRHASAPPPAGADADEEPSSLQPSQLERPASGAGYESSDDMDMLAMRHCLNCTGPLWGHICMDCGHMMAHDDELFAPTLASAAALHRPRLQVRSACGGERNRESRTCAAVASACARSSCQTAKPAHPQHSPCSPRLPALLLLCQGDALTVISWDERMELHEESGSSMHPERPDRVRAVMARLQAAELAGRCRRLPAREATPAEIGACHIPELLAAVDVLSEQSRLQGNTGLHFSPGGRGGAGGRRGTREAWGTGFLCCYCCAAVLLSSQHPHITSYPPSADTYVNQHTAMCAKLSAGACVDVTHAVVKGEARAGVAVVRPPGHHAESNTAMGFCFFNNAGIAARAAQVRPCGAAWCDCARTKQAGVSLKLLPSVCPRAGLPACLLTDPSLHPFLSTGGWRRACAGARLGRAPRQRHAAHL